MKKTNKSEGVVLSVNISDKKGEKKRNVGECRLLVRHGVEKDAHAGDWNRQVSLLSLTSIEKMRGKGLTINYGDFAENLTVDGIDVFLLPVGTVLEVGAATVRITKIGKECHIR
ncbi:MAG: MOSC domain-containing protein [Smithellaceae bacterium]|nr:MOSC domain-containing protein [Smithellaceae bacterium]